MRAGRDAGLCPASGRRPRPDRRTPDHTRRAQQRDRATGPELHGCVSKGGVLRQMGAAEPGAGGRRLVRGGAAR